MTERDLAGRGALVTAASRGIGLAIAAELLARGASVTISARKPDALEEAAGLVGFLVSDAAAWITGETVRVDGGLLATGLT